MEMTSSSIKKLIYQRINEKTPNKKTNDLTTEELICVLSDVLPEIIQGDSIKNSNDLLKRM